MLGTDVSPYSAISTEEAQYLLNLSAKDYRDACSEGILKSSVNISTALNGSICLHNFWDLLEFALSQGVLNEKISNIANLSADTVDEIARLFDQRNQDGFDLKIADTSEIISFLCLGYVRQLGDESKHLLSLARGVSASFHSLVSKCISACVCDISFSSLKSHSHCGVVSSPEPVNDFVSRFL